MYFTFWCLVNAFFWPACFRYFVCKILGKCIFFLILIFFTSVVLCCKYDLYHTPVKPIPKQDKDDQFIASA